MAAISTPELLAVLSAITGGGLVAAIVQVYRARPERDNVIVSSAQNAATILEGLNKTLHDELNLIRAQLTACQERCKQLQRENDLERILRRRRPTDEDPQ